ncbi:MAG: aminoacetone oxidase family FAD-binding enzyme [Clostridia bacterium]|nr:aminoacetone oxidase family FAD-binding enzyme [Clostridia bacterium]
MSKRLAIIGGGAAGAISAIEAKTADPSIDVVIFERMSKLCKKILVTGNGRCNFTNEDLSPRHFYGDTAFLRKILTSVHADNESYFRELGVLSYKEDGRIYPRSQQGSTIREALENTVNELSVDVRTDTPVTSFNEVQSGFKVNNEFFDCVIVSVGGKASPVQGSDGSCIDLIKKIGHKLTPLYPALCGLITNDKALHTLKGVRAEAKVSLYTSDKLLGEESGEVQFTEKAISGIPVMNLSHLCKNNKELMLRLDLCEEVSETELKAHFTDTIRLHPNWQTENLLGGIVNAKLGYMIINQAHISKGTPLKSLRQGEISKLITLLKNFEIKINGTKDFSSAQITCGGVNTSEIDGHTMMSKLKNGLFFCGEILDIHGDCGGYNLHLAWTTGRIAGCCAAEYLKD